SQQALALPSAVFSQQSFRAVPACSAAWPAAGTASISARAVRTVFIFMLQRPEGLREWYVQYAPQAATPQRKTQASARACRPPLQSRRPQPQGVGNDAER